MTKSRRRLVWATARLVLVLAAVSFAGSALADDGLVVAPGQDPTGPACNVVPAGQAVCTGTTVTFTGSATGGLPGYSYCWHKEPYTSECLSTAAELTLADVTLADAGQYRVTVTDAQRHVGMGYATLTVCEAETPRAVELGGPPDCKISTCIIEACEGTLVQFCGPDVPGYTYLWHGPEQDGATTQCIYFYAMGTYTLTVTDASGLQSTCSREAPIYPKPRCGITGGVDSLCGSATTTWCATEPPPGETYYYRWEGPEDNGATTRCITIGTPGIYKVYIQTQHGCESFCSRTLHVGGGIDCTITGDDAVCRGGTTQWCAPAAPPGDTYGYLWHGPEQDRAVARCITIGTAGAYTVTVTSQTGCQATCGKTLTANDLPQCDITGPDLTCVGHAVRWCAPDIAGYTYSWSGPEQNGATSRCIDISTPGEYAVTVTDANGCWSRCNKFLAAYQIPDCLITGADWCCASQPVTWCAPDVTGWTYLWSGPEQNGTTARCITISTPGDYTVLITDANGCQQTCYKSLSASPEAPECSITCESRGLLLCPPVTDCYSVCPGSYTTWCAPDVPGYTYLWHGPEQDGATTRCITIGAPGTYTLAVTDAAGCSSTCSKDLTLKSTPICQLTAPDPLPECGSTGNRLSAAVVGSVATYAWSISGSGWKITSGKTSRTITYTAGGVGSMGDFQLIVTGSSGCKDTCAVSFGCREVERICTYTQTDWGRSCPHCEQNNPNSTKPGCIRDHFFSQVFPTPNGVTMGGSPYYAAWTTPKAVEDYLPASGSSGVLASNLINPTHTPMGTLGGQVLALRLNREFSCAGVFYQLGLAHTITCYGSFVIPASTACGSKFAGMTVDQFLAFADLVLAGNLGALPPGTSLSDLKKTATCLNEMFTGCQPCGGTDDPTTPLDEDLADGDTQDSAPPPVLGAPPVGDAMSLPKQFNVSQNYPNPANPGTTINFALPTAGAISIEIYDVRARKVATLIDGYQPAGYHSIFWNGADASGNPVPSGVYFCKAQFGSEAQISKKLIKLQ